MKANELRIGNFIQDQDEELCCVYSVNTNNGLRVSLPNLRDQYLGGLNVRDAKPIPLTEEWLLKFGFELSVNGHYQKGAYKLSEDMEFLFFNIGDWAMSVEYVHQLQNLYFALTGEELELKEKQDA